VLGLLGCAIPDVTPACDPRSLAVGEARARRVACNDELVSGGDGHVGDWLLENALARFVIRDPAAGPLTELDGDGGTLVDAVRVGEQDVLLEFTPDVDRSAIEATEGPGWAELRMPGATWHLEADSYAVDIDTDGRLLGEAGVDRTGATLRDKDDFFGADGVVTSGAGAVRVEGVRRLAVAPEGLWSGEVSGTADADSVLVQLDGVDVESVDVDSEGTFSSAAPEGATVTGVRAGCVYDGLTATGCGTLTVRVQDDEGTDLPSQVCDAEACWPAVKGGEDLPVGPDAREMWLWAGPAYSAVRFAYTGDGQRLQAVLDRAISGGVQADLAIEAAPDADDVTWCRDGLHEAYTRGAKWTVAIADDEVPEYSRRAHDEIIASVGSRVPGWLWSWPWSPNSERPGHGAVPHGLGALDTLAVSEGGQSRARRHVVTAAWAQAATAEAPAWTWEPVPDAMWLDDLDDLPTFLSLLDAWLVLSVAGPVTWVQPVGALDEPAVEASLVNATAGAGNGPRLTWIADEAGATLLVEAAGWMGVDAASAWTPDGETALEVADGQARLTWEGEGPRWVVFTASGRRSRPWLEDGAWAVSAPLWRGDPAPPGTDTGI
jgi:hypothetical protein